MALVGESSPSMKHNRRSFHSIRPHLCWLGIGGSIEGRALSRLLVVTVAFMLFRLQYPSLRYRTMCLPNFHSLCSFAIFLSIAATTMAGTKAQLQEIGDAIRHPNTARLLELAEHTQDQPELPDVQKALKNAAIVYAYSTGNADQIRMATAALSESESEIFGNFDALKKLNPIELSIDPTAVSSGTLQLVFRVRQSIVEATMIGNTIRIDEQLKQLREAGLPATLGEALANYGNDALAVAQLVPASPLKIAVNASSAAELKNALAEDRACEQLAAYIEASPKERILMSHSRGVAAQEPNQFDLMKEIVSQQPALIAAFSKIQEQYWLGEIKRAEAIIKMQEAIGNSLDLRQKRLVIYWQMHELNKEKNAEKNRAKRERLQARNEALDARTLEDISPTWPSIFQHAELRAAADQLLHELRYYSRQNCGVLSVCYSKCAVQLRKLDRLLADDLPGLTLQQRAMLRTYLRELDEELQKPFDDGGVLLALATQPAGPKSQAIADSIPPNASPNAEELEAPAVQFTFSGDERELASFAVYQTVLGAMVRAGTDHEQLSEVAKMIRASSLLNEKHRKSLQEIGSKIYRGEIDVSNLASLDDPVSTLVRIVGIVDYGDFGDGLPESMREEAFQILLADVTR